MKKKREEWQWEDTAKGPQGAFRVSTVRTYAGGAPNIQGLGAPFGTKDFAKETPWPYETMVFSEGSSKGLYHEPSADQGDAEAIHCIVIEHIQAGDLQLGRGVSGPWGNPSMTPADWRKSLKATA
jgi:hypothetical protein